MPLISLESTIQNAFDYIVIGLVLSAIFLIPSCLINTGGGTAGLTAAQRLAEHDINSTVLVIEAGGVFKDDLIICKAHNSASCLETLNLPL